MLLLGQICEMGELFFLGSIFCAFLTVYILLFKENAMRSYADYLLSFFFMFQIWCITIYLLIYSGWIVNLPHLYKTAAPINFILSPLSYLYVRSVLFNEKKFSRKDIIHFIPFLFFVINYTPFFILSTEQKKSIVEATTRNYLLAYQYKAGMIPEYISNMLRLLQVILYLIYQWKIIIKFKKSYVSESVQKQVKDVLKWLKVYTWSSTVFLAGFIIIVLFAIFSNQSDPITILDILPSIIISLSFFLISIYLLVHPEVLTGLPFIKYQEVASALVNDESDKIPFISDDYHNEIAAINEYFNDKQPYLINSLTISQVSVVLNIPVRELSYIINNHYLMRFNDFLNGYRINHIINNYNAKDLDKFTIESLAKQSGFTSKSSFYRAFNKIHSCTPNEYFQNLIVYKEEK